MKIILVFVAACALVSTVRSAPFDSAVKSQDGKAEDFHFNYDKVAKQDDELVRDLIARAMQSLDEDDPYSVEMQGWLTDALSRALQLANNYVNGEPKIQEEDKNAEEQHSFKKAVKQEDKLAQARDLIGRMLVRDLIARAVQSQDDPYSAEMQGWLWDALKHVGSHALRLANNYVNGGSKIKEEDTNAEEQHSFNFDEKAAKQEDKLARDLIGRKVASDLIARAMQLQDDPYSVEMQGWLTDILKKYGKRALQLANDYVNGGPKIEEGDVNAEEQHSFNFHDRSGTSFRF